MKKFATSLIFLLVFLNSYGQEWINSKNPFKDPTPTPTWKTGNFLEVVYELDLKASPDTANLKDWVTINDININSLSTDFVIGTKSYKVDFPGVSVVGGKFKFKLYGPDYDVNQTIRRNNWKSLTYQLKYTIKGLKNETVSSTHNNDGYKGIEGTITVNR